MSRSSRIGFNSLTQGLQKAHREREYPRGVTPLLPLEQIQPDPDQPRKHVKDEAFDELVQSLKARGLLQPIRVVRTAPDTYVINNGERRYHAACELGWTSIPATIVEASDDPDAKAKSFADAIVENAHRKDLNAMEDVEAIMRFLEFYSPADFGTKEVRQQLVWMLNHEPWTDSENVERAELADRYVEAFGEITKSWKTYARRKVYLLDLPPDLRDALRYERINEAVATLLAKVDDSDLRLELLERAEAEKLSRNQVAILIKEAQAPAEVGAGDPKAARIQERTTWTRETMRTLTKRMKRLTPEEVDAIGEDAFEERLEALTKAAQDLDELLATAKK